MKRIISILLILTFALSMTSVFASAATGFSDLKNSHWAYGNINILVAKGGIAGYPDGTFKPGGEITNAEFIKIVIGSTIGTQAPVSTDKHWASGYIAKALEVGIIKEGELEKKGNTYNTAGLQAWDWPITRNYMAVIIARSLQNILKEDSTIKEPEKIENSILDYPGLCDYCKPYIVAVYAKGIVTGYPNNEFGGSKRATRAEAATMLVRMLEPSMREKVKILDVIEVGDPKALLKGSKWLEERSIAETVKYTILSDITPYNLELGEKKGVRWVGFQKDFLAKIYFMKNGEIVEALQSSTNDAFYTTTDITTVDYIVSVSATNKAMILLPNPFKIK